jgi:lipopolysaccharide/colanic/teichoic acid biosynthesis glycosyltransferase
MKNDKRIMDPLAELKSAGYSFFIPEQKKPSAYFIKDFRENKHTSTLLQKLIRRRSPLKKKYNRFIKRTIDIVFSLFSIVILFPLLLPLFAIVIKLNSKGPVFFLQKRNKKNGAIFSCIKLRTMLVNDEADIRSTWQDDERITTIGKYLRKYHLDELPQLINVLIGDMSLIGPRPHMISENLLFQKEIKEYSYRNEVKPGITGLSQSLGNFGATDDVQQIEERLLFDLLYIKHWSLKMEIKIVHRTIRAMLMNKKEVKLDIENHLK